jgi:hypothetical protein
MYTMPQYRVGREYSILNLQTAMSFAKRLSQIQKDDVYVVNATSSTTGVFGREYVVMTAEESKTLSFAAHNTIGVYKNGQALNR